MIPMEEVLIIEVVDIIGNTSICQSKEPRIKTPYASILLIHQF